MKRSHWHFIKF